MKSIEDLAKTIFIDDTSGRFHTELLIWVSICLFISIINRIRFIFLKK